MSSTALLLVSQDSMVEATFRELPAALGRPLYVARIPALTHSSLRKTPQRWHLLCLDTRTLQGLALEALQPLFRHLIQRAPALKWVALGDETELHQWGFPRWLRFHKVIPSPWTSQRIAREIKPLLFPPPDVQAALTHALPFPSRPNWLEHPEVVNMLENIMGQVEPLQGLGWWDEHNGVLLWRGEPLPSQAPVRGYGSTPPLERLAWWSGPGARFWFYAVPVFRHTWIVCWGVSPFPFEEVRTRVHSLRETLHHMEPPQPPELLEEGEQPSFPEEPKPLFTDVPPPFPEGR